MGEAINKTQLDLEGTIGCLRSNFKPSARAWRRPQKPTTLGPTLRCIEAISFLSAKVKKAIEINTLISVIRIINIGVFFIGFEPMYGRF